MQLEWKRTKIKLNINKAENSFRSKIFIFDFSSSGIQLRWRFFRKNKFLSGCLNCSKLLLLVHAPRSVWNNNSSTISDSNLTFFSPSFSPIKSKSCATINVNCNCALSSNRCVFIWMWIAINGCEWTWWNLKWKSGLYSNGECNCQHYQTIKTEFLSQHLTSFFIFSWTYCIHTLIHPSIRSSMHSWIQIFVGIFA